MEKAKRQEQRDDDGGGGDGGGYGGQVSTWEIEKERVTVKDCLHCC